MKLKAFVFLVLLCSSKIVFATPLMQNNYEDLFKYDDSDKIPHTNANVLTRSFIADRGNEDVCASLLFEIDFPKGDSQFERNMRDIISKQIYGYLKSTYLPADCHVYIPGNSANEMVDYYAISYLNSLNESFPLYVTDTLGTCSEIYISRVADSPKYVTYSEHFYHMDMYHNPMPHPTMITSFRTYDKQKSESITFNEIFQPHYGQNVKKILIDRLALAFSERREEYHSSEDVLRSVAELNNIHEIISDAEYRVPAMKIDDFPIGDIALLPSGVLFYYPKYKISYGYEGDYSIIIGYNELDEYLLPSIKENVNAFYGNLNDTNEIASSACDEAFNYIGRGDYDSAINCLQLHVRNAPANCIRERELLAMIHLYRCEDAKALLVYQDLLARLSVTEIKESYITEAYKWALLKLQKGEEDANNLLDKIKPEENTRGWLLVDIYDLILSTKIQYGNNIEERLNLSSIRYQIDTAFYGDNLISYYNHQIRSIDILSSDKSRESINKQIALWDEVLNIIQNNLNVFYPYETYGMRQLNHQSNDIWGIQNIKRQLYESLKDYPNAIKSIQDGYNYLLGRSELTDIYYNTILSKLFALNQQLDESYKLTEHCYSSILEYTSRAATALSLDNRNELYELVISYFLEDMPFILSQSYDSEHCKMLFESSMIAKGLKVSKERTLLDIIRESNDNEVLSDYNTLKKTLTQIDAAIYNEESLWKIDSLKRQYYKVENQLLAKSTEFGNYLQTFTISCNDVYKNLKSKEAAIEFVSYKYKGKECYYALVITNQSLMPDIIHIFDVPLDNARKQLSIYDSYDLVWKNIINKYRHLEKIYFSPTGLLTISPIENADRLNKKINLIRLSSCSEVLEYSDLLKDQNNIALFGGLDYDANITRYMKSPNSSRERSDNNTSYIGRGTRDYLPGSLEEVRKISMTLTNSKNKVSIYTDIHGTETAFKKLEGKGFNVIHIATHGDYIANSSSILRRMQNYLHDVDTTINLDDKDLTRSVLLMSGANLVLEGHASPNPYDDGILSATEISRLDLSGVDLVVLSACKSGLGELNKDGVAGLQRGFKKAGVGSIIMTLWEVDDTATSIMMQSFYKFICKGNTMREAFKRAQNELKESKQYSDPRYWAAFIMLD